MQSKMQSLMSQFHGWIILLSTLSYEARLPQDQQRAIRTGGKKDWPCKEWLQLRFPCINTYHSHFSANTLDIQSPKSSLHNIVLPGYIQYSIEELLQGVLATINRLRHSFYQTLKHACTLQSVTVCSPFVTDFNNFFNK